MMTTLRTPRRIASSLCFVGFLLTPLPVLAQGVPALSLPMSGIDTFHPVTTIVALGSDARPEAMPGLKKAGFALVISIREDNEAGYDRAGAERAATENGLRFISIPFARERPDPEAARRFLEVMAATEHSPAYIYCHTGQRAAAMWLIKRVAQDGWPMSRALAEAESLGLTRPELKQFAADFIGTRH